MNKKSVKRTVCLLVCVLLLMASLCSCREATMVSHNISQQADNFNVTRKLTVLNVRTDKVLYELVGNFSIKNEGNNELSVISEVGPGEYKKDFVYLNEWTTYVIQDVSGAYVDQYHYEVNILPQMIGGVTITSDK